MLVSIKTSFLSVALVAFLFGSASAQPQLVGDLNLDHVVDFKDLRTLTWQWLDPDCLAFDCIADIDKADGVNMADFAMLANNWQAEVPHVVISEFMASNANTLLDGDGLYSDWIEIYSPSSTAVNLEGWYLTDSDANLTKWQFPDGLTVEPGEFLIVFASGKTYEEYGPDNYPYQDGSGYYHTNFNLDKDPGEYLALVAPDGSTVIHEYAPEYPIQLTDISYGFIQYVTALVPRVTTASYHVPTIGDAGVDWTATDFDDSGWDTGQTALGFARVSPETGQDIGTPLVPGSYSVDGDVYTVTGDGDDIWDNSDSFYYVYTPMEGDVDLIGRVVSIGGPSTSAWRKAGVMIRETLDGGSKHAMMAMTPTTGYSAGFQWRSDTGGSTGSTYSGTMTVPYWIRIVREGNTFKGYHSPNGIDWTQHGNDIIITMADVTYIGLAVTSHSDGVLCTVVFDNVMCDGGISTDLQYKMLGVNASVWSRIEFEVEDPTFYDMLTLRMKYEDSFVAYLNGQKVASKNAPASVYWDSTALSDRPFEDSSVFENINIMSYMGLLHSKPEKNVLAIQGLNDNKNDDEFLLLPELITARNRVVPEYFTTATPGTSNIAGAMGIVSDVWFSCERGFYDTGFKLMLSTAMDDAEIRYTIDGSYPTIVNGLTYTYPLEVNRTTTIRAVAVKPGWLDSPVETHSYIFLDDVILQPSNPDGFPTTWGGTVADYEMDPDVVGTNSATIKNDLKAIPTISLVTDPDNLFDPSTGIYVNTSQEGLAWERPVSVEFIDPDGGPEFQVNGGMRIHGGWSRWSEFLKHSIRLYFRNIYGPTLLRFPLFPDTHVDTFDKIVLRAGADDSWVNPGGDHYCRITQYQRDQFARDIQRDMGDPTPHGIFVHLYINGIYWGLYNPIERPDAWFAADYLGGYPEQYDILHDSEVIDGDKQAWDTMMDIASGGLSNPEAYQQIQQYLDVENLINYIILNCYIGNVDWPHRNWYAARKREPEAGFKFFSWDAEQAMYDRTGDDRTGVLDFDTPAYLYYKLRDNADFRMLFADHLHRHFFNNGVLTPAVLDASWMSRAAEIDRAIVGESARWGDSRREPPYTRDVEWMDEQNLLRFDYLTSSSQDRSEIVLNQFRAINLYPEVEAPIFSQHGGQLPSGFDITMDNPNVSGWIWYTTDGNDPRLPEGEAFTTSITLVSEDASKRVLVPTDDTVDDNWKGGGPFNDTGWNDGTFLADKTGGVGYDEDPDYDPYITYDVEAEMNNQYTSCYIRIPFTVDACDLNSFNFMTLKIRYDDGFVIYLNGTELVEARRNFSGTPSWDSGASSSHDDSAAVSFESIPVSSYINVLQQGDNILAIHGLNYGTSSSDFLISVELVAGEANSAGSISSSAIEYNNEQLTFNKSTLVKARVLDGITWSALNEAIFAVGPVAQNLRITEIMYHPGNTGNINDPNTEFIELKNIGTTTLNLNLVKFTEGINFTFPSIDIEPDECVVVVRDEIAFESKYGTSVNVAGRYTGSLANGGEKLKLVDAIGRTILDFEYKDSWYPITDGDGFSLVWHEDGLFAHWKFDDGPVSSVAVDSAGSNNGTLEGNPTWTTGRIDGALSFDGDGDYVSVGPIEPLVGDSFTVQAWVRLDGSAWILEPVLVQKDSSDKGYYLYFAYNMPLFCIFNGSSIVQAISPEKINTEQWYHVAATNDGSNVKVYVDGLLKISESSDGFTGVNEDAHIGSITTASLYYSGLIDDVRIYDRALGEDGFPNIVDPRISWSQKGSWRPSVYRNGSPGWDDDGILPNPGAVVINEVMSHSNTGTDWIELYNTTSEPINIGGWFLSDDDRDEPNLTKYRIHDGTVIGGNDYIVFYQDANFCNPNDPGYIVPFALSENGEKLCLSSRLDPNGMLTGYRYVENFGASQTNVSFGRYFKRSTGSFNFVAMDYNTPDVNNAYPKVGPVVINEIMYNPANGNQNEEYVELHNISSLPVTLYRIEKSTPWKFTDGIDYTFSATSPFATIPPDGYLMVVKDKTAFEAAYGLMPFGVDVVGGYDGWLSNAGERLQIAMPGDTDELGTRYYIRTDRVTYSDGSRPEDSPSGVDKWPTEADGGGKSLSRKVASDYGNDVANWKAAEPSPGEANP